MEQKIRVKVASVRGIKDPEGREGYRIDFVEVRERPPVLMATSTDTPEEISKMVMQISKGLQYIIPGGAGREYELQKITLHLTADELEAFELKPYPNQMYEITISKGKLSFRTI
ncbi:arcadin 1 [Candidatus Bathyarchaeota archaeon]|nr:arcadin 1 [Candidatus Bathyarchaeota archaeon]